MPQRESVILTHLAVDRLCRQLRIRCLGIKGPIAHQQGLRTDKQSADVDVLVDPTDVFKLEARLEEMGWTSDGQSVAPHLYPQHAVTLRHPYISCELDLHWSMPGLLAADQGVFDSLWECRSDVRLETQTVLAPRPAHHLVILAVSAERESPTVRESQVRDLWSHVATAPGLINELSQAAGELAASLSMDTFVASSPFHLRFDFDSASVDRERLNAWRRVKGGTESDVTAWLIAIWDARGWRRLRVLWRAIWPTESELRRKQYGSQESSAKLRMNRWSRAVQAIPRVLNDLRRLRLRDTHSEFDSS